MYRILILAVLLLVPGVAWGVADNCDCPTSHTDAGCETDDTGDVTYTSHIDGTTIVGITLASNNAGDTTYTCGQYANGDYWILGEGSPKGVRVASTFTDRGSGLSTDSCGYWRDGWDINPEFPGDNRLDGRERMSYVGQPNQTLPRTFTTGNGPVSFIKAKGSDRSPTVECGSSSYNGPCIIDGSQAGPCINFAGVFTFVDAVPDSDGDTFTTDEFRPAYSGVSQAKHGPFTITGGFETRAGTFPGFDASLVDSKTRFTFADAKWGYRWPLLTFAQRSHAPIYDLYIPLHSMLSRRKWTQKLFYGHNRMGANTLYALRFMMDDFTFPGGTANVSPGTRNDDEQGLINYVQSGIDTFGDSLIGTLFCAARTDDGTADGGVNRYGLIDPTLGCYNADHGGITQGPKVRAFLTAYMLDDPMIKAWVAGTGNMLQIRGKTADVPDANPNMNDRDTTHFTEDEEIYWASDGNSYYGTQYRYTASGGSAQARLPGQIGDSQCNTSGKAYASRTSNMMPYQYLLVNNLDGGAALWNQDAYLDYSSEWHDGTRGTHAGDPANPQVAGIYCPLTPAAAHDDQYYIGMPCQTSQPPNTDPNADCYNYTLTQPYRVTTYTWQFGEEMWSVFSGDVPTSPGVSIRSVVADPDTGTCGPTYTSEVSVVAKVNTALCDPVGDGVGGDVMNYYVTCPDGTTDSDLNSDLLTNTFVPDCDVTLASEANNIGVEVTCVSGVDTYVANRTIDVSCDSVAAPVVDLDLIACGIDTNGDGVPDTDPSILNDDFGDGATIVQSDVGTCYSVCVGDTVDTGSLEWFWSFGGAPVGNYVSREVNAPYCINGEYGWWQGQEGGTPNCVCDNTPANIGEIGTHTLEVIPYENADFGDTGVTGTTVSIDFTVSPGTSSGESCDAPDPWNQP